MVFNMDIPLERLKLCKCSIHAFCKNSEYDQEIPQSQTVDKPMAPRGRATQKSQARRKTN